MRYLKAAVAGVVGGILLPTVFVVGAFGCAIARVRWSTPQHYHGISSVGLYLPAPLWVGLFVIGFVLGFVTAFVWFRRRQQHIVGL